MSLKETVEKILEEQQRSLSWLATEMGKTFTGLKMSLVNESIKYADLKKMVDILNIPITILFDGSTSQKIKGNYNNQAGTSMLLNDPEVKYKKIEVDGLKKQIQLLESKLVDKDKIIELLTKK